MRRFRRVLYATDFSRASRPAFTAALGFAKLNHASLLVVHVLTFMPPFFGGEAIPPRVLDQLEASAWAGAHAQLKALIRSARRAGVRVRGLIVKGSPYDQITRAARLRGADVIVLGTHGRTGLTKALLGSVATRVLATARCPVLTVHHR
jgi:nucleotide-binding universal stress UspA family protein